jgi:hypothetical protein
MSTRIDTTFVAYIMAFIDEEPPSMLPNRRLKHSKAEEAHLPRGQYFFFPSAWV